MAEREEYVDLARDPEIQAPQRAMQDPLTYVIIGAAQKVHTKLGMGFTEAVYHNAMCRELTLRGVAFESQPQFEVHYEETLCGTFKPDIVVMRSVIVELKAVSQLCPEHRQQTLSYLKASGLPKALLMNFGAKSLELRRFEQKSSESN